MGRESGTETTVTGPTATDSSQGTILTKQVPETATHEPTEHEKWVHVPVDKAEALKTSALKQLFEDKKDRHMPECQKNKATGIATTIRLPSFYLTSDISRLVRLHKEEHSQLLYMKMIGAHVQLLELFNEVNTREMEKEDVTDGIWDNNVFVFDELMKRQKETK